MQPERQRGKKTRHRITGVLSTTPVWVRTGRSIAIDGLPGVGVQVTRVSKRAAEGKHDAAQIALIRFDKTA